MSRLLRCYFVAIIAGGFCLALINPTGVGMWMGLLAAFTSAQMLLPVRRAVTS